MFRSFALACVTLSAAAAIDARAAADVPLVDGGRLRVRLVRVLTSETARIGDAVILAVDRDVVVNGQIVLLRGTVAAGTVVDASPGSQGGSWISGVHPGRLAFTFDSTTAVDGQPIRLRATSTATAAGGTSRVVMQRTPRALMEWAAEGTTFDVFVDGNYSINTDRPARRSRNGPERLTNEDVIKLVEGGIGEDVVLAKIYGARTAFRTDALDLMQLKKAGVPDAVVIAMIEASSEIVRIRK